MAVLISIKPKYCELIANGEKTIEVRKIRPKCETPFKCYIYCTNRELLTRSHFTGKTYVACHKEFKELLEKRGNITLSGKIIGEFICDKITDKYFPLIEGSCLSVEELHAYANRGNIYGWHISNLVIYDKPKELSDFKKKDRHCYYDDLGLAKPKCKDCKVCNLTRPPQSWCYCEELK